MNDLAAPQNLDTELSAIQADILEGEQLFTAGVLKFCDAGEKLRKLRAVMTAKNFVQHVAGSLGKSERWIYQVMEMSYHRMSIANARGFREAEAMVRQLPPTPLQLEEKKAWPSSRGQGGGRPKSPPKPEPKPYVYTPQPEPAITEPDLKKEVGYKELDKEQTALVTAFAFLLGEGLLPDSIQDEVIEIVTSVLMAEE